MIDAAGGRWPLRAPTGWNLIGIKGLDPPPPKPGQAGASNWHRATAVLISTPAALEGPLRDDIAFAFDEDANLVWAADLRTSPSEAPGNVSTADPIDDTAELTWRWGLRRDIPAGRYPYLHGSAVADASDGAGEDVFVRANMVGPDGAVSPGPTSPLLAGTPRLRPLALPASGLRLICRAVLARGVDGRPVLWYRRVARPRDTPVDVDLRWDVLSR